MLLARCVLLLVSCCLHVALPFCVQTRCDFTNGLFQSDILPNIRSMVNKSVEPNVLKIMSWNILHDIGQTGDANWNKRKDSICDYINKLNPMVFSLQEVRHSQLVDLQACLRKYSHVGEPRSSQYNPQYNPIFYLKSKYIKKITQGTFWLSNTSSSRYTKLPYAKELRICSWAKFEYAVVIKSTKIQTAKNKLHRLLSSATGNKIVKLKMRQKTKHRKNVFTWKTFYVANTHLNPANVDNAADQVKVLLDNFRNKVMDRRRYPLLLMGSMSWEAETKMYKTIQGHELNLKDVMTSSQKSYPKISVVDMETGADLNSPGQRLGDQIWNYGFTNIFSGTLMDRRSNGKQLSDHRPIITVTMIN